MIKKIFSIAIALSLLLGIVAPAFASTTNTGCEHGFSDIIGHWAEESICELYESGVIEGYSPYNFAPNSSMTRAEFVKVLLESMNYNVYSVQSASFTDTVPGEWYYSYVTFAHSKGFVSGYSDGSFHPNSSISRAEAITLLVNMAGFTSYDTSDLGHQFTDVTAEDWFAVALAVSLNYGLIEGYGDGSFRPNSSISRAEACILISRTLEALY